MNRRGFLLSALAATMAAQTGVAQTGAATLLVEVSYTGSGTVDETHKITVVLWDTAEFVKEGTSVAPIAAKMISSKSGKVTFESVQKSPAYISMAYDPSGQWDGQSGPPPAGTSLGLYANPPGTPAPIELKPAKTTKITAAFDDSFKMK